MKNPFLNTSNYIIVHEFNRVQEKKRSLSNTDSERRQTSKLKSYFVPDDDWRTREWRVTASGFSGARGREDCYGFKLESPYEHLRHTRQQIRIENSEARILGLESLRYQPNYLPNSDPQLIESTKKMKEGFHPLENSCQHKKKPPEQKSQPQLTHPYSSSASTNKMLLSVRGTNKVTTKNIIEYYQYSCSDSNYQGQSQRSNIKSKQNTEDYASWNTIGGREGLRSYRSVSHHAGGIRDRSRGDLGKENYEGSYHKIANIANSDVNINIDAVDQKVMSNTNTNTNISSSLCNINAKAKANRYSSRMDVQDRPNSARSDRKKCSIFQAKNHDAERNFHDDGNREDNENQNEKDRRIARLNKRPSKLSNFHNQITSKHSLKFPYNQPEELQQQQPQQVTQCQSQPEQQGQQTHFIIPSSLLVRNKTFYLCKNYTNNYHNSYCKPNQNLNGNKRQRSKLIYHLNS